MAQQQDVETVDDAVALQQSLVDVAAQLVGDVLAGRTPRLDLVAALRTTAGDLAQLLESAAARRHNAKLTPEDVERLRRWGGGRA